MQARYHHRKLARMYLAASVTNGHALDLWEPKKINVFPHLKSMRLSSPRFAYLKKIRKTLFRGFQLVATPGHLEHFVRTDILQIAPYIEKITFVAPSHGWTLSLNRFKEVLLAQAIQRYTSDNDIWYGTGSCAYEPDGHWRFVQQYWNGNHPFSDETLFIEWQKYHQEALAIRELLLGRTLKTVWTKVLNTLPKVRKFRFRTIDYEQSGGDHLPVHPDYLIRPHHHDSVHRDEVCRKVAAPLGDAVFAAGVACLAEAKTCIHRLDVACVMTGSFAWPNLPGWKDLDLSRLRKFKFRPQTRSIGEGLDPYYDIDEELAERAGDAVAAVLRKCKNSLEEFDYDDGTFSPMALPDDADLQTLVREMVIV